MRLTVFGLVAGLVWIGVDPCLLDSEGAQISHRQAGPDQSMPPVVELNTADAVIARQTPEGATAAASETSEVANRKTEVQSSAQQIQTLRQAIASEKKLLDAARKQTKDLNQASTALRQELRRAREAGAAQPEIEKLQQSLDQTAERAGLLTDEARDRSDRLFDLHSQLAAAQQDAILTLQDAESNRLAAAAAQDRIDERDSPFALRSIGRWLLNHGLRVLIILVVTILLFRLARFAERRFIAWIAAQTERGTWQDRENRAKTVVGVFHHTMTLVITIGSVVAIANEVGFNVTALVGGVAVVGLAVAFGVQNLMRDYFSGFVILLESQYAVNDVVKIGEFSGLVESVTLRLTRLRSLDGTVHFIPNGQITSVSNMTHGWSRAVFDIPIAYKEDTDRVSSVLMELGKELRSDPAFADRILEDPQMLGVDSFGDSAVIIKFFIKTRPLTQWDVKREMLRRIKKRFDELRIEIPFPHRTLYHRHDATEARPKESRDEGGGQPSH